MASSFAATEVFIPRGRPVQFGEISIATVGAPVALDRLSKRHWHEFHDHDPQFNFDYLKRATFIQAFDGETAIGYLVLYVIPNAYDPGLMGMVDTYYLEPEYRSRGIAKGMFELAQTEAFKRGARKLTASYNLKEPHRGFFAALGFAETHVIVSKEI